MSTSIDNNSILSGAINALHSRNFFTVYPESPKAYPEDAAEKGMRFFQNVLNTNYNPLDLVDFDNYIGEEVSPFLQVGLGIKYPVYTHEKLICNSKKAKHTWAVLDVEKRALILINALERVKSRFFDIAYATMHTTGQSFLMSFQASGPHANDRALEAIAVGFEQLTQYPREVEWIKPMGKFELKINKNFKPVPKGVGLVIGCSTFPTWNTVPGVFANLITGNTVIVKPHPKAILPIAIVIEELQKEFKANSIDVNVVQLAVDSTDNPITKQLSEHSDVKLIDYTGGSTFGDYIENLSKTTFTEKAGINSVIVESTKDIQKAIQNIVFSVSLYSGQMCTAPQNIFVSKSGIMTDNGTVSFDDFVLLFTNAIRAFIENPKAGPGTLGAIQNDATIKREENLPQNATKVLESIKVMNEEFPDARIKAPVICTIEAQNFEDYSKECFGPYVFIVKTDDNNHSLELAKKIAIEKGTITCLAFSTNDDFANKVEQEMNEVFVPVSFNFSGAAFVNQHAAFSDLHVTGGNPAGNASFTNSEFITKRFVWVGNRYYKE